MTPRSRVELLEQLDEQMGFLSASCQAYDQGMIREYKRIALTLRILLRDTRNQQSLLNLLGVKDRLEFENTATQFKDTDGRSHQSNLGLVILRNSLQGIDYLPKVQEETPWQEGNSGLMVLGVQVTSFDGMTEAEAEEYMKGQRAGTDPFALSQHHQFVDWWTEPLMRGNDGDLLTREFVVTSVANTDGGAHVDRTLKPIYEQLSRRDTFGWKFMWVKDGEELGYGSPFPATIRQIGHEVLTTIKRSQDLLTSDEALE